MRTASEALRGLGASARSGALRVARTPSLRWRALALLGVALILAKALKILFAPFFVDTSIFGFRDWDQHAAYSYITVLSLKRYHELPFWHPWFCGGFPAWGYVEGATNLVSPYLPLYLAFPLQLAERLEIILSTVCAFAFTFLLASRFSSSNALRTLVALAYAFNGRWVMQFAEGHTWHLQYAWMPLALYFFDVSLEPGKLRWAVGAGASIAMTIYMGGVYPLPHTALILLLYACILASIERRTAPILALVIAGASSLGFAAPKLFPVIDFMMRAPRKIASTETMGLGQLLAAFIDATGSVDHDPPADAGLSNGWLEYGIYLGVWLTGALVLTVVATAEKGKAAALRGMGVLFLVLGCGAFHKYAPWPLLHEAPVFSSQHVPSRFLIPAVLTLMLAFARLAGRQIDRPIARRPWIDLALLVPVYFIATNLAAVGELSTKELFMFKAPHVDEARTFTQSTEIPYKYDPDWHQGGRQVLLGMFANLGSVHCYGVPPEIVPGAIAKDNPRYKGEAYVVGGGEAQVTAWTPNTATVRYEGARPDATLVYNMNYDTSWRANGTPAINYSGAAATRVTSSSGEVTFRYYPRTLNWGLLLFVVTCFVAFGGPRRTRDWLARRRAGQRHLG